PLAPPNGGPVPSHEASGSPQSCQPQPCSPTRLWSLRRGESAKGAITPRRSDHKPPAARPTTAREPNGRNHSAPLGPGVRWFSISAGGRAETAGEFATLGLLGRVGHRQGGDQPLRVVGLRLSEHLLPRALLEQLPLEEHPDAIGEHI